IGCRRRRRSCGAHDEGCPTVVPNLAQVGFGCLSCGLVSAGDEKYRNTFCFCCSEKNKCRHDRFSLPACHPTRLAAWPRRDVAGAICNAAIIVRLNLRPIRERRFIDVKNDCGLANERCSTEHITFSTTENGRDVTLIAPGMFIIRELLFQIAEVPRYRLGRGLSRVLPRHIGEDSDSAAE